MKIQFMDRRLVFTTRTVLPNMTLSCYKRICLSFFQYWILQIELTKVVRIHEQIVAYLRMQKDRVDTNLLSKTLKNCVCSCCFSSFMFIHVHQLYDVVVRNVCNILLNLSGYRSITE